MVIWLVEGGKVVDVVGSCKKYELYFVFQTAI
jgi:hypothetical protein